MYWDMLTLNQLWEGHSQPLETSTFEGQVVKGDMLRRKTEDITCVDAITSKTSPPHIRNIDYMLDQVILHPHQVHEVEVGL